MYFEISISLYQFGMPFLTLDKTSSFIFFTTSFISLILKVYKSFNILVKSSKLTSLISSVQVFISRPLFCCNLKFSAILSIIIVLFKSLPSFDKSLKVKIEAYFITFTSSIVV